MRTRRNLVCVCLFVSAAVGCGGGGGGGGGGSDVTAPTVSLTAPANEATVSGTVTLTATASDDVGVTGVRFEKDGTELCADLESAPYGYAWDTTEVPNGAYALTAFARDGAGNTRRSSPVMVTVANTTPDTTAPVVFVTSPSDGATVSGTVALTASVVDEAGVAAVALVVNDAQTGSSFTEDPPGVYATSIDSTLLSNGTHAFQVCARDPSDNVGCSSVVTLNVGNVVPDTTPPTVSITSPADGATVSSDAFTVKASVVDDRGVGEVTLHVDGVRAPFPLSEGPAGVFTLRIPVSPGDHTVVVCAVDTSDNLGCSPAIEVTVTVTCSPPFVANDDLTACVCPSGYHVEDSTCVRDPDTTPPVAILIAPSDGETVSGAVTVVAEVSDDRSRGSVCLILDGNTVHCEFAIDTGNVVHGDWDTSAVADGPHTLRVCGFDAANNIGCSTLVTVTVDNYVPDTTPPTVFLTAPEAGALLSGTVSVTASAVDDRGVAAVDLIVDGVQSGLPFTEGPAGVFSAGLDSTLLANGSHTLKACATDTSDNVGCSADVSVSVHNHVFAPQLVSVPLPAGYDPRSLPLFHSWGSGPDDVYLSSMWNPSILHWNGSTLEAVPLPAGHRGHIAIWGSGPDDVWLDDEEDLSILHWNGVAWTAVAYPSPTPSICETGLWGSGPYDVWATQYNAINHFDGSSWTAVTNPAPNICLQDVWGSGPDDAWIVGNDWNYATQAPTGRDAVILHWDGSSWSLVDVTLPHRAERLVALWGSGPDDVWAIGTYGGSSYQSIVLHWDGQGWSSMATPTPSPYMSNTDVWGSGPDDVWVVGRGLSSPSDFNTSRGTGYILHWDGVDWAAYTFAENVHPHTVWGSGPDDVWIGAFGYDVYGTKLVVLHHAP